MPGQILMVPAIFPSSMIRLTSIAAVMLSGMPVSYPSPWPVASAIKGSRGVRKRWFACSEDWNDPPSALEFLGRLET